MNRESGRFWIGAVGLFSILAGFHSTGLAGGEKLEVLATSFPIYQITRNVAQGREAVAVELMIPAQLGCPHDYALTPQDVQKISGAKVLIINGLGMEAFLDALLQKASRQMKVIDSSAGIGQIIQDPDAEEHEHARHEGEDRKAPAHEGEDGHEHRTGANPHLFASPRMVALQAMGIAAQLSRVDPAGAGTYLANAQAYAQKMNRLADDFEALGRRLKNNRIVTQHGVFDYLARDMGLTVVAVVEEHAGQEPSAAEMLKIVATIQREKAAAIFTEPQYPQKIGRTLAREAGIATATLDPVASGPQDAPLDYYDMVMRKNLATLEGILGTR